MSAKCARHFDRPGALLGTNFATIEQLEIELVPGFSVLTGETGAGKSIIVDALSLLLRGVSPTANGANFQEKDRSARTLGPFERSKGELPDLDRDSFAAEATKPKQDYR
jgi:AAA15 family ATPase/GTPase